MLSLLLEVLAAEALVALAHGMKILAVVLDLADDDDDVVVVVIAVLVDIVRWLYVVQEGQHDLINQTPQKHLMYLIHKHYFEHCLHYYWSSSSSSPPLSQTRADASY